MGKLTLEGKSVAAAARSIGEAPSNVYRWIASNPGEWDVAGLLPNYIDISSAIQVLACTDNSFCQAGNTSAYWSRLEAFFVLIFWLRWPKNGDFQNFGVIACMTEYLYKRVGVVKISDLDPSIRQFAERYICIDTMRVMCSDSRFGYDGFYKYGEIDDQPQDEDACLADIGAYLVSHGSDPRNPYTPASIGKAIYLANQNAFRYKWSHSSFSLRELMRKRSSVIPFCYANRESALDLPSNPNEDGFPDAIDEILKQPEQLQQLLGKARWVVDCLKSILDRRALVGLAFPDFPAELTPIAMGVAPLDEKIKMRLKSYRAADKTLNWLYEK